MVPKVLHMFDPSSGRPYERPFSDGLDKMLFLLVLIFGGSFAYAVHSAGLGLVLVDQFSHLSIARQITDSLTPGMSQIGFWPPLLHVLLTPFASIDVLYYSGYASAFLLVPLLGVAVVLLARLLYLLTEERFLSYLFAAMLLLNPYVLYFAVTPMMETLFLLTLVGATYYFARWWLTSELSALILTGTFISLATLARFEGFILLPLIAALILYRLWRKGVRVSEIEALGLIFGLIATTGIIFTLSYGLIYNDNPLAFMSNNWGAQAQQQDLLLPAKGDFLAATTYMGAAAKEMLGLAPLLGLLTTFVFLLVTLIERRVLIFAVISILVSPFLFDILATYQGSAVIYVPYLPPYNAEFFNARYGLFLATAAVVIPALAASLIARTFRDQRQTLPVHMLPVLYVLVFLSVAGGTFSLMKGDCTECFPVVQSSRQSSPDDHEDVARILKEHYDGGYILMTRALHNEVAVRAGIPLRQYILEANEHYFGRAVETPWLYARYVVMFSPNSAVYPKWQRENEQISRLWGESEEFAYFYEELYRSETEAVYKLREPALRAYAYTRGIPEDTIPALAEGTPRWDVAKTHAAIEGALDTWRKRQTTMESPPLRVSSSQI